MKMYVLTQGERDALITKLELEKFKESQFIKPEMSEEEKKVRIEVHRVFHRIVCEALEYY